MKKSVIFAVCLLLSAMGISCAFRTSANSFGPYSAAESFFGKGDYPEAIEKYQEYLAANPRGNMAAVAEYYIGKSYMALGDVAKAGESFERVVTLFPETSWAEFAKEQLEALPAV